MTIKKIKTKKGPRYVEECPIPKITVWRLLRFLFTGGKCAICNYPVYPKEKICPNCGIGICWDYKPQKKDYRIKDIRVKINDNQKNKN